MMPPPLLRPSCHSLHHLVSTFLVLALLLTVAHATVLQHPLLRALANYQPAPTAPSLHAATRVGLTLDFCDEDRPCKGRRTCQQRTTFLPCEPGLSCVCFAEVIDLCYSSKDCSDGEKCAYSPSSVPLTMPFCVSPDYLARVPSIEEAFFASPTTEPPSTTAPPPTTPPPPPSLGDRCSAASACPNEQQCFEKDSLLLCTDQSSDCACYETRSCKCNRKCDRGDLCVGVPDNSFCFPSRLIADAPEAESVPCIPESTDGLNGERCSSNAQCRDGRQCVAWEGEPCVIPGLLCESITRNCTAMDSSCFCYQEQMCECTDDCEEYEMCIGTTNSTQCISPNLVESFQNVSEIVCSDASELPDVMEMTPLPAPNNLEDAPSFSSQTNVRVCIDATALEDFHKEDLVYEDHPWAYALCDSKSSCATSGHMVIYHGVSMMMRRYCDMVGCVERAMKVNSPKLKPGIRIPSKTNGLVFTALAATFATRTEETLLSAVIRFGM